MSIVSSIRDYVEFLNNLSDSLGNDFTSNKFITETSLYFLKTLQYSVYYILSFQWLRDFTLLPITIPQISKAIFSETFFLENPEKVFFEFLEIPSLNQNKFILGVFNSFFLTLPITVTHIIALRRFLIQGIPAAFFSFLGFIIGQTLFILCVTFGIRSFLIPWLSLEPLNYIIGLILIFQIVYSMVRENLIRLKWNTESHKRLFKKFFLINLILSWCEQSCIFQYLSNLTLTGHPSILEGFSTKTTLASFFSHSNYIFGIFLGSILFSILWMFVIWQLKNLVVSLTRISIASFIQTVNRGSFVVILGFTLSSIPFYSLEYLVTGPLGFISQDNVFKKTIFDENQIKVKDPLVKLNAGMEEENLNFNVSLFDRGRYLLFPEANDEYSFEDLNYRGEKDWITRSEKMSNITDSKGSFFSLSQIFKKQKSQFINNVELQSAESNIYPQANFRFPEKEDFNVDDEPENRFDNFYNLINFESSDELSIIQNNFKKFSLFSFSNDFLRENSTIEANLEKKIKQKYYSNPIYKNLLALDIDLFLNRQPASSFLQGEHELDLYEKRQMLNSYYDSLRLYKHLPYSEKFEDFFNGTKSFTNKIYNQQFKGTLRSIQRLFSLSANSTDFIFTKKNSFNSVLKYDQPLYESQFNFSPYHEEIAEIDSFYKNKNVSSGTGKTMSNQFLTNFVAQFISKPLYAGWDENLRKFVITNKLLPRFYSGYEINLPQEWDAPSNVLTQERPQLSSQKATWTAEDLSKLRVTHSQKINFTVWPKSKDNFNFDKPEVPFTVLFKSITKDESFPANFKSQSVADQIVDALPETQKTLKLETEKRSYLLVPDLAPKRGGFVWPGNLNFNFKNIFK